jgi:outer membrane murein-binding lipoprotein Lpp
MTANQELVIRRDALQEELQAVRALVAAREEERSRVLGELEASRAVLVTEVKGLAQAVAALEAVMDGVNDAWSSATREAAAAKAHLAGLSG